MKNVRCYQSKIEFDIKKTGLPLAAYLDDKYRGDKNKKGAKIAPFQL